MSHRLFYGEKGKAVASSSYRLSYGEKGKAVASSNHQPRISRVRVPQFDTSALIKKHALTLIGRITNPQQRIWSLIPFLSDMWKTSTRAIGADLGQGLFQFQFATEEDLQLVLANRPYHFAKWMVILQRWEPTVDPNFPCQIPFWIKVQGVPSYLWSKETLKSIADDLSTFEDMEISNASARMRVTVNGHQPLITSSIVEFFNGDEVTAQLVYEKLERHCSKCLRLTHEVKDCPLSKPQAQEKITDLRDQLRASSHHEGHHSHPGLAEQAITRANPNFRQSIQPAERISTQAGTRNYSLTSHHKEPYRRTIQERSYGRDISYTLLQNYHRGSTRNQNSHYTHSLGRTETSRYHRNLPQGFWREKKRDDTFNRSPIRNRGEASDSSRPTGPNLGRAETTERDVETIPQQALEEARGELREVMVQYTSCADPSESAVRRERVRQAEQNGQFEQSATQMARAALAKQISPTSLENIEPLESSRERIPIDQRLGPVNDANAVEPYPVIKGPAKKKVGRPAGSRKVINSPSNLPGVSSRKIKTLQVSGSPRKRLNLDASTSREEPEPTSRRKRK
ncbi:hypothetical protein V5N11_000043 [Cardamine amara subsp. amara]|uniref:DUF4283 domain-containing protein n=1 Tax=Cardamine amara subsp. amara TaxID=228776 RepID=A0ABD1C819_CARAN